MRSGVADPDVRKVLCPAVREGVRHDDRQRPAAGPFFLHRGGRDHRGPKRGGPARGSPPPPRRGGEHPPDPPPDTKFAPTPKPTTPHPPSSGRGGGGGG